ncbi:PadR family transcriptional regulator [Neobacillus sp. GCM10023253]|uniref:PadR family transcriptional regulator n=1 Tax=Neobacillus sp. GCM10023253 TaxID=3252644 RepID=UPI003611FF98
MIAINTLGYAILSVIGRKPCTGYELVNYLDPIWPAKHSQIYPLLTKLEDKGLLVHEFVEQMGRPNKKIFSITEKGKEALANWMVKTPSDPVNRDEFLIKVYSSWVADEEKSIKLIHDRMAKLEESVTRLSDKIKIIEETQELETNSKNFGRYLLFHRKFRLVQEEKAWCQWVLNLLKNKKINIPLLSMTFAGKLLQYGIGTEGRFLCFILG